MSKTVGGKHIKGGGLNASIGLILKSYSDEVKEQVNKECEKEAKALLKKVRQDSHKVTGDYAKGWHIRRQDVRGSHKFSVSYVRYVIYNDFYWLTHLLEHGHTMPNGKRAQAFPHIEKNREDSRKRLTETIKEELGQ